MRSRAKRSSSSLSRSAGSGGSPGGNGAGSPSTSTPASRSDGSCSSATSCPSRERSQPASRLACASVPGHLDRLHVLDPRPQRRELRAPAARAGPGDVGDHHPVEDLGQLRRTAPAGPATRSSRRSAGRPRRRAPRTAARRTAAPRASAGRPAGPAASSGWTTLAGTSAREPQSRTRIVSTQTWRPLPDG